MDEEFWDIIDALGYDDEEFVIWAHEYGTMALSEWDLRPALAAVKLNWAWN